nr:MAG TPA: hypothetical protein [Caudoviricetes sp.]
MYQVHKEHSTQMMIKYAFEVKINLCSLRIA